MATHELPEWETRTAPKRPPFFGTSGLLISALSLDRVKGLFSQKNAPPTQQVNKETIETVTFPSRKFWRPNRRIAIIIIIVVLLLIALIIGLAVGLTHKSRSSSAAQNLPLPSNTDIFTGDLTYYSPGPGYGACGYQNTSAEAICAVSHTLWDAVSTSSDPNANPLCGRRIRIARPPDSRSVDVEVVDRCVGCLSTDLDLSLSAFTDLADEALGRVVGSWAWLP